MYQTTEKPARIERSFASLYEKLGTNAVVTEDWRCGSLTNVPRPIEVSTVRDADQSLPDAGVSPVTVSVDVTVAAPAAGEPSGSGVAAGVGGSTRTSVGSAAIAGEAARQSAAPTEAMRAEMRSRALAFFKSGLPVADSSPWGEADGL